jgi:FkbM family methyltransferase
MNLYYKIQSILRFPIPIFIKILFKKYFGKNNLDQQIEKFLNFQNGFFVELGAHDGVTQSNTFYFEKNKNWRGILIEPTPHVFKKCEKFRSNKNHFFNCACVSFNFKDEFIKLTYSGLKTFSDYLRPEKQKQHLSKPEVYRGETNFTFLAPTRTLNSILVEVNAPFDIDFLSLDTEGAEFEVLNGIDFKKYKFKFMLIESDYFSELEKFLFSNNYKFVKKYNYNDYLFKYDFID